MITEEQEKDIRQRLEQLIAQYDFEFSESTISELFDSIVGVSVDAVQLADLILFLRQCTLMNNDDKITLKGIARNPIVEGVMKNAPISCTLDKRSAVVVDFILAFLERFIRDMSILDDTSNQSLISLLHLETPTKSASLGSAVLMFEGVIDAELQGYDPPVTKTKRASFIYDLCVLMGLSDDKFGKGFTGEIGRQKLQTVQYAATACNRAHLVINGVKKHP